jgi:hypothetical protein
MNLTTLKSALLTLSATVLFASVSHAAQEGAQHRLLVAASGRVAIVSPDGSIEREVKASGPHDTALLPNGNILTQVNSTKLAEYDPSGKIVWEYDSAQRNGNEGKPVEVHSFQRLENDVTMIAESGPCRIIEVDRKGSLLHEIKLTVDKPHKHRDTRTVRKTPTGTYLVAHEGDGKAREYDRSGKVLWEYSVPLFDRKPSRGHGPESFGNQLFSAIRIENGNTLIATGNGHSILEVSPAGQIVWKLDASDLPEVALAWITRVERLPNGNTRFGNCHAGPNQPLSIEVDPSKKIVWKYLDYDRFGNNTVIVEALSTHP